MRNLLLLDAINPRADVGLGLAQVVQELTVHVQQNGADRAPLIIAGVPHSTCPSSSKLRGNDRSCVVRNRHVNLLSSVCGNTTIAKAGGITSAPGGGY